jgi:hypothetical protein
MTFHLTDKPQGCKFLSTLGYIRFTSQTLPCHAQTRMRLRACRSREEGWALQAHLGHSQYPKYGAHHQESRIDPKTS